LRKAGLTIADIDLIELNEAFAVQALHNLSRLGLPPDDRRVNIWGGSIAYGHPLAASVRAWWRFSWGFSASIQRPGTGSRPCASAGARGMP